MLFHFNVVCCNSSVNKVFRFKKINSKGTDLSLQGCREEDDAEVTARPHTEEEGRRCKGQDQDD